MKKLCSKCKHINEYDSSVCEKCGCELDEFTSYKMCPACGRQFSIKTEECPECREILIVAGTSAAMVFDETAEKDGIPVWLWAVGVFLPVLGIIIAWIYSLCRKDTLQAESAVNLRLVCLLGQVVWIIAIGIIIKVIIGYVQ